MPTILGLDLGANSIGWALINTDNEEIISSGVRIFPEGVENYGQRGRQESKNKTRRDARGLRKQNQRYKMRRNFVQHLIETILIREPIKESFFKTDPYQNRSNALHQQITINEFARALFHLNQRRGFQSNRKDDGDNEKSKIFETKGEMVGINDTEKSIISGGFLTLGEYLNSLNPHEIRRRSRYTKRSMYKEEFNILWDRQSQYHKELLTEQLKEKFYNAIFFQRKLKSQKDKVAKCLFEPKKKVAPKSSPTFQLFRILEQLSRLKIVSSTGINHLTQGQKDILLNELMVKKEIKFDRVTKLLSLSKSTTYNLQHEKKLIGHRTYVEISKLFDNAQWKNYSQENKHEIWHTFYFSDNLKWLKNYAKEKWNLPKDSVEKISKIKLEKEYGRISKKAMDKITPFLKMVENSNCDTMTYDKAAKEAGYHHSDVYERQGKMSLLPVPHNLRNPIVQKAVFELRNVVNDIVDRFGNPERINIELVRDLKLPRRKREKVFAENEQRKKEREEIKSILNDIGIDPTHDSVLKYKLWIECDKTDPYSGNKIHSIADLFNGGYQIEHIIPLSTSLDDSNMNKTLCDEKLNQEKLNRTPWQAWGETEVYSSILERAKKLPYPKYKRFLQKNIKKDQFVQRQLVDTAYISKEVKKYLGYICKDVTAIPGQATAKLRHFWGLNSILNRQGMDIKNREDHRHHAVDALVVAMTTKGFVQKFNILNEYNRDADSKKFPIPWECFRIDVQESINKILVSYKIKKETKGKLHKETNYGQIKTQNGKAFVITKQLSVLTQKEIQNIVDQGTKQIVFNRLEEFGIDTTKQKISIPKPTLKIVFNEPLYGINGQIIKKVRVFHRGDPNNMIQLYKDTKLFVEPGSNHHIAIFENIKTGKRVGKIVSRFEAMQRRRRKQPVFNTIPVDDNHKLIMTLQMNEMVLIGIDEKHIDWDEKQNYSLLSEDLYRMQKMDKNGILTFRHHQVSLSGSKDPGILYKNPNTLRCIKVFLTESGEIKPSKI